MKLFKVSFIEEGEKDLFVVTVSLSSVLTKLRSMGKTDNDVNFIELISERVVTVG